MEVRSWLSQKAPRSGVRWGCRHPQQALVAQALQGWQQPHTFAPGEKATGAMTHVWGGRAGAWQGGAPRTGA